MTWHFGFHRMKLKSCDKRQKRFNKPPLNPQCFLFFSSCCVSFSNCWLVHHQTIPNVLKYGYFSIWHRILSTCWNRFYTKFDTAVCGTNTRKNTWHACFQIASKSAELNWRSVFGFVESTSALAHDRARSWTTKTSYQTINLQLDMFFIHVQRGRRRGGITMVSAPEHQYQKLKYYNEYEVLRI